MKLFRQITIKERLPDKEGKYIVGNDSVILYATYYHDFGFCEYDKEKVLLTWWMEEQ